jgi:RNA polymerase sigma factor (sigma-70 family)
MDPTTHRATSPRSRSDEGPSDEALLFALRHGDPEAGITFVRRYQRRVYGLAHSIVGNPTQAEEIAQETLIRAWRHAHSYDPRRGSVSTWLLTITRNLAVDTLRRKGAEPADPRAAIFLDQPAHGSMPEGAASVTDETSRVRTALSRLPSEQRRALLLAAFYGYTAREISQAEAIPLITAKTRARRGLTKVRSLLRQDEITAGVQSTHPTTAYSSQQ